MIESAAIWKEDKIYTGSSHRNIRDAWGEIMERQMSQMKQIEGFLTDDGVFLNRKEAAAEALKCGKITQEYILQKIKEKNELGSWMLVFLKR